jgi:hypothetical protein
MQGELPTDLMEHPYWSTPSHDREGIEWGKLQAKEIEPPWVPEQMKDYIDNEFLRQKPPSLEEKKADGYKSQGDFNRFTFIGSNLK